MKLLLFCLSMMLLPMSAIAQTVTSKPFGVMLDALLKKSVPLVNCQQVKQMPNAVLLDTRAQREYAVSHLPNARWVGYNEFDLSRVQGLPKTTPIIVYCSVGYRSEKVGEKLLAAGYKQVYNLYGSIFEWVNEGNEVVDSTGQPTQRVHAYNRMWGGWLKRGEKVYE